MSNYERPSFNKEWWTKVENFLDENPHLGFEKDDTKQFLKYCVNRKIEETKKDKKKLEEFGKELSS